MSLQNKGFWMVKGAGHATDGRAAFDNPSRFEAKRSHQWFVDSAELEMLPNKRQAVEVSVGKSGSGIPGADITSWGNSSGFHSVPNQFMDRLFGPETARSVNFAERNISPSGTDASVALSISHVMEDPENSFTYNGIRKVKVNQVKENNDLHASKEDDFNRASHMSTVQAYSMQSESNFISMGEPFVKEDNNVMLTGHSYSSKDVHVRLTAPIYSKGDENPSSLDHSYSKQDSNILSFSGFHDEHEILPVAQPTSNYDSSYNAPSVQTSEVACGKELESLNANAVTTANRAAKSRNESTSKSKPDFKASRKEAPNSFPSNVRSLISTGMLDGVPVKYVSLSREELRGIIKGSGYLCGCQSCSYSKVLNAYEFERHAGCKTKHPNNHIYFENGKTIYQIVQELRSTPESMLFDAIQTVFGAPINQKSFRIWKESFQAATRELQRIYGKEELNL